MSLLVAGAIGGSAEPKTGLSGQPAVLNWSPTKGSSGRWSVRTRRSTGAPKVVTGYGPYYLYMPLSYPTLIMVVCRLLGCVTCRTVE